MLLALGLPIGDFLAKLAWVTLGTDLAFLAAYLRFKDIPPFVFDLLLALVGSRSLTSAAGSVCAMSAMGGTEHCANQLIRADRLSIS